jgi:hypothetical protein
MDKKKKDHFTLISLFEKQVLTITADLKHPNKNI